ncbi:MAG: lamin tail domain-containing protein, partial [Planctomycetota bacterium]
MLRSGSVVVVSFLCCIAAQAQLQITEIQYESNVDWIEVRNTGAKPIDLHGYVLDDDDGQPLTAANISKEEPKQNTVLKPGQLAVLFGIDNPEFGVKEFRRAWELSEKTMVVGVRQFPGLSRGGDQFGFWKSLKDYSADRIDESGQASRAVGFDHSVVNLKFGESPTGEPASITWSGKGDPLDLKSWVTVEEGTKQGRASRPVAIQKQVNSTSDTASPGKVKGKTTRRQLFITEIMYNPNSEPDSDWEFIEMINLTGSDIDFTKTPFTIDDLSGDRMGGPNIVQDTVKNGETFVLFSAENQTLKDMHSAWGKDVHFIPVEDFPKLSNSRDTIGVWSNFNDYAKDKKAQHTNRATVSMGYSDGKPLPGRKDKWPKDNGMSSIYLDLKLYPTRGSSWQLSSLEDGISRNAKPAIRTVEIYRGGDIG